MWNELGISGGTAIVILIALYFVIKWAVKNGIKEAYSAITGKKTDEDIQNEKVLEELGLDSEDQLLLIERGGKIMEKDKKEKIRCICFLFVSICNFIVSIVNFMDKNTTQAVTYLLLGISLLLLSTTNLRKNK